ncbi:type Z 30S ribosomal protein S14 [Candidatus Peregrinibacteria bacterium]|nr:type Z 30S ribosomal protein S14 [Candidatus Peregrinibacteria bacterium]
MARTALIVSCQRKKKKYLEALSRGKKTIKWVRVYNRCRLCGRSHGYMRFFDICRICFRELARKGEIAGITKSSW